MVSERRACRVLSQPRMTQRYEATRPDDEERLVARARASCEASSLRLPSHLGAAAT